MKLPILTIGLTLSVAAWSKDPPVLRTQEGAAIDGEGLLSLQASNWKVLEEELGIQILSLRLTSADSLLGLRFRVVNSEKATPLFDRDRPHMIHQASGAKLRTIGPPNHAPQAARPEPEGRYAIVFGNTNRKVKHGDIVTILVGDYRVEDIVVFSSVDPTAY